MAELWRWRQQQWEAVQGPMTDSGLAADNEEAVYRGLWQIRGLEQLWEARKIECQHPMPSGTWQQHEDGYRAHGRVAKRKQLKLKAIQRPMLKSPPSSSV
ncbi:unnamed protein product, partial [Staurois parvus]